jgi:hypothetical protein
MFLVSRLSVAQWTLAKLAMRMISIMKSSTTIISRAEQNIFYFIDCVIIRNYRIVVDIFNWHRSWLVMKRDMCFLLKDVFPHLFSVYNIYPTLIHSKVKVSVATKMEK